MATGDVHATFSIDATVQVTLNVVGDGYQSSMDDDQLLADVTTLLEEAGYDDTEAEATIDDPDLDADYDPDDDEAETGCS